MLSDWNWLKKMAAALKLMDVDIGDKENAMAV